VAEEIAEPVHVLHVMPGLGPGGIELALSRIVRGLSGLHMQHSVVCLKGEADIRDQIPTSAEIHCMHAKPNEILLPWRLRRLLRRVRPTVIHARNWSAWPDIALARLLLWHKIPLIISFHGFDSAAAMPLRRRIATRLIAATAARVFTVTEASRRLMIEHIGLPADRVEVIPNGVDVEKFKPGPPRAAQPRIVVGTVGSLSPVKNHALLIRASALASQAGADVELRIAGEGPERARLTELIHSLNLQARVQMLGHQTEIAAFLRTLDIFVLPSESEAHPNALLEAMACGLPCIGTRVGGLPEVLGFGQFGRLVERGDADGLSRAIMELARNPAARESLGRAARARILDCYSMDQMLKAYSLLYREPAVVRHLPPADAEGTVGQGPCVLMLGPLPPLTGGMATVIVNLCRSQLADRFNLLTLNNGKTTRPGRTLIEGIASQVWLLGQLVQTIRANRVQLVHLHTCEFMGFWRDCIHMFVARMLGCRGIWHIHGARFDEWAAKQGPVRKAVMRRAFEKASAVIVLSNKWHEKLRPFAERACWRVVPNGIPMPSPTNSVEAREPVFLFLGDWSPRKGVQDLVAATALAVRSGFNGYVHLAGFAKEPGQTEALEESLRTSGCASRIRVLGTLTGPDKEDTLAKAACLVLPSYGEGLPMAILEAMSHALPIIATPVGAIPELITEGVEGFLVRPGDVQSLADRLVHLGANADLRVRMGKAARRRVEAEYDLEVMAQRVSRVYDEVLSGAGKQGG